MAGDRTLRMIDQSIYERALAAHRSGDPEAAIAAYERIFRDHPHSAYAVRIYAQPLSQHSGNQAAIDVLSAWLDQNPPDDRVTLLLATLFYEAGRIEEADDRMLKLSDPNVVAVDAIRARLAAAMAKGRYEDAERLLRDAIRLQGLAPMLTTLYKVRCQTAGADAALAAVVESVAGLDATVDDLSAACRVLLWQKQPALVEKVLADRQDALNLDVELRAQLGEALYALRKFEDALSVEAGICHNGQGSRRQWLIYGHSAVWSERCQEARSIFAEALRLYPDDVYLLEGGMWAAAMTERHAEAVRMADEAWAAGARTPHVMAVLVSYAVSQSRFIKAYRVLKQAMRAARAKPGPGFAEKVRDARKAWAKGDRGVSSAGPLFLDALLRSRFLQAYRYMKECSRANRPKPAQSPVSAFTPSAQPSDPATDTPPETPESSSGRRH